jgi:hypothetical protein
VLSFIRDPPARVAEMLGGLPLVPCKPPGTGVPILQRLYWVMIMAVKVDEVHYS